LQAPTERELNEKPKETPKGTAKANFRKLVKMKANDKCPSAECSFCLGGILQKRAWLFRNWSIMVFIHLRVSCLYLISIRYQCLQKCSKHLGLNFNHF
jgi:hypothetical protein